MKKFGYNLQDLYKSDLDIVIEQQKMEMIRMKQAREQEYQELKEEVREINLTQVGKNILGNVKKGSRPWDW